MVQNLNILSFASYGNLLTERPGGVGLPKGPHWEERLLTATAQETYQYLSSDSVYLDYESGIPGYGLLSRPTRTAALST